VQRWSFGPSDAERITQPVLNVLGAANPTALSQGLNDFFSRHPIGDVGQPDLATR
jgi:hypothetical protein